MLGSPRAIMMMSRTPLVAGFVPRMDQYLPAWYGDWINGRYWYNGNTYNVGPAIWPTAWLAAIGFTAFTRSTTALYTNASGLLVQAAIDEPRFDYDPSTGELKGYLHELGATNVCLRNRDLTNASWVKTNCTAAKDQTGADGTASGASRITATSANGTCLQTITLASSVRRHSAYIKRLVGTGTIEMTTDNGSTWTAVVPTAAWLPYEIPGQTVTNPVCGFRIGTSGDSIAVDFVQNETDNGARTTPTGTTAGTTLARGADTVTHSAAGTFWNSAEGTLLHDHLAGANIPATVSTLVGFDDNTANNTFNIRSGQQIAGSDMLVQSGAVSQVDTSSVGITIGTRYKYAIAGKADDFVFCSSNNVTPFTDNAGLMPVGVSRFRFAATGHRRQIAYYPKRISDATLQAWVLNPNN